MIIMPLQNPIDPVTSLGRILLGLGLVLAAAGGLLMLLGGRWPRGRLPGDILVEREGFTLWFPLGTCILLSLALTGLVYLVSMIRK